MTNGSAFFRRYAGFHENTDACPDCLADVEIYEDETYPGLWHMDVRHEETCPSYRRMRGAS